MNQSFLNNKLFVLLTAIIAVPIVVIAVLSFVSTNGTNQAFSLDGFREIFSPLRLSELLKIAVRALIVCTIATAISFFVAYLLVHNTSKYFQLFFFILITLPFLANESVRVFSWQYLLSENGLFNQILSSISGRQVSFFNGTNIANVYLVMIITCIPFGLFINAASLRTIPNIYWKAADDLNLNSFNKFWKIALPLSKFAIIASLLVTFFISFSLSSEVNFLGGDSKISLRNLILSLMSASKFQSIFSLGFLITILLMAFMFLLKEFNGKKISYSK
ncbi:MAG: ABC transporter permease subunit [Bacteroidetes bacterium]|nr:ABC transporter permease subunit [Bacteroidota bacterium]